MVSKRCHLIISCILPNPSESECGWNKHSKPLSFETTVTNVFPPGICLGPHDLRCYNIDKQDPTEEARIDERASLVVSFTILNRTATATMHNIHWLWCIYFELLFLQQISCAHWHPVVCCKRKNHQNFWTSCECQIPIGWV